MNVKVVIGCPGAGKSTYLAGIARSLDPKDTIILSYSRSAAHNIAKKAGSDYKSGTIHSLCFNDLGVVNSQMFLGNRIIDFCRWAKMDPPNKGYDIYNPRTHFMDVYNYARTTRSDIYDIYYKFDYLDFSFMQYVSWVKMLISYKETHGLFEFDDLLDRYTPKQRFTNVLIDESQDLSSSMTIAIEKLVSEKTKNLLLVGDPVQSIYTYSGSDPKFMFYFGGKQEFLDKSYRCPAAIVAKAKTLFPEVKFNPIDEPGEVSHSVEMPQGADMVLVRTNYIRHQVIKQMGTDPVTTITIHKAKGQEANHVVIVNATTKRVRLSTEENEMAEKRVLYTAITRARKRLTIVESRNANNWI